MTLLIDDRLSGVAYIFDGIIGLALAILLKSMLFDVLDQGKFKETSERM